MASYADMFKTFDPALPCGENLEYSPEFLALQQAVAGKPEQQFGATIIPEQAPDWAWIEREASRLCGQTCDIRVLVLLTHAWTESKGLPGFADGMALLLSALEEHWDDVYPLLIIDGEHDPMPRINALVALGDLQGVARSVRSATLLKGPHGQVSVREAETLLDGSKSHSEAYPGGRPRLVEALRHAHLLAAPELLGVARALAVLTAIEKLVAVQVGSEWLPDFAGLRRTLGVIASATEMLSDEEGSEEAQTVTGAAPDAPVDGLPSEASASQRGTLPAAAWQDVVIQTRGDALLALEKASVYFEHYEPSHPAPFLIRRVQQTIPLDFYEMLKDLAPQGLDQFKTWVPKGVAE